MGGVKPNNEKTDPPNNGLEYCHEVPRPQCKEQDISLGTGPGSILGVFQAGDEGFNHLLWFQLDMYCA